MRILLTVIGCCGLSILSGLIYGAIGWWVNARAERWAYGLDPLTVRELKRLELRDEE